MHKDRTLTWQQLTTIRRAAEDACMAANPRLKSFVDTVAHPLNIIALCNMAEAYVQPPQGHVVVPLMPTVEMVKAAIAALDHPTPVYQMEQYIHMYQVMVNVVKEQSNA